MHFAKIDLDFSGLTSFEAGWKFHLYCDLKREEILNGKGFFKIDGADNYHGRSNKFLEDKLVYEKYNNWEKLVHLFNNVPKIGSLPNVSHETVGMWYAIIANYIKDIPSYKSTHIIIAKILNNADGIIEGLKEMEKNKKAVEILGKVYEEII